MLSRRELFPATVAVLSAAGLAAHAQQPGTMPSMPGMKDAAMTLKECIESCSRTGAMCLDTARYCMEKGGPHAAVLHLALLLDCAEMCETTAHSLLRHSPKHAAVCTACAELCDACGKSCVEITGDEKMSRCAKECFECAQHCREMSRQTI